ncbi:MAG: hypothetical protein Ct9H90mP25_6110 [Gammaproteobacteria bacterium]|nr:MAG: hypothetical protein Ct9H90mP25_6110 [Gammaproteobacteria bacterium]
MLVLQMSVIDDKPAAGPKLELYSKFSPDGELLLTIGTPGEIGDPPTHLTDPNDVLIAPNGRIFIAETHGAQFPGEPSDETKNRITMWEPEVLTSDILVSMAGTMGSFVLRIPWQWILKEDYSLR